MKPGVAPARGTRGIWLGAIAIVVAAVLAYANSFSGAFVFDDGPSIVDNASIRSLSTAWSPPAEHGQTVGGRPLVNVAFALNYAWGGLRVAGYHVTNLLIHCCAALVLFGVVRRTLVKPACRDRFGGRAPLLAALIAGVWVVHPLQTAAVTSVVQRAESLCALFYLATLYAFIRATDETAAPRAARAWSVGAVLAGLAGMACKEVMVTAPVMILLYDRTFVGGSWREVLRRRWLTHAALASTWLLLAVLVWGTQARAGSAGFASALPWPDYATTQIGAVAHYLRLAFWPHPLVFDYGTPVFSLGSCWPQALLLVGLVGATGFMLWRRPAIGFLGAWFFVTLAPSSSVVPIATQTLAEHRVYLALAAVVAGVVLAGAAWLGRAWLWALPIIIGAGIVGTLQRNIAYRTPLSVWMDTVAKVPDNARAQLNLGVQLAAAGRNEEALARFREAVRLAPADSDARNNLAGALHATGQPAEALEQYADAVRLGPRSARARRNFGQALANQGRWAEAREQLEEAARIQDSAAVQVELGRVLLQLREPAGAENAFRAALAVDPASVAAHVNLGNLLLITRRAADAVPEFEAALRLAPATALIHAQLGVALAITNRIKDAKEHLQEALRLDPGNALARTTLARLLQNPDQP